MCVCVHFPVHSVMVVDIDGGHVALIRNTHFNNHQRLLTSRTEPEQENNLDSVLI